MPELPEVEVVRRGLAATVVDRAIDEVEVHHPRAVRRHAGGAADFAAVLVGQTIVGARRRGKYLWLPLESGDALMAHLGMSGQLLVRPVEVAPEIHLRVRLSFRDQPPDGAPTDLRFVDQRTFGGVWLSAGGAELPAELVHIAPDPLEQVFDDADFMRALRSRRTGLKRALLDQSLISGVGNIYADEALWRAHLHYARPTETMNKPELTRLLAAIRTVFGDALAAGGTSFDALYVNVNGQSGYFDRSLAVYGQEGRPCLRCGTPIRREAFMNRSSYLCPRCQPRPRRARW